MATSHKRTLCLSVEHEIDAVSLIWHRLKNNSGNNLSDCVPGIPAKAGLV